MSVIRKKPFIEMVIDSLSPAMKDALAGVLNNQPATINRDSSFADMPSVNTVTAVYFKLDETNFKNGILIYNSSYCVLVAYHRFQDLLIYQLNVAAKQYAKINEYLDINELRRVLNDRVGKDIDAGEIDSGEAVEGQVLAADGAGGANWIGVMDAITPETVQEGDAVQLFGFNSQGQLVKDNMPEGITVDQSVIEDSPNAVSGGAVYDELAPMKEDIDALEADMENKANKDGNYQTMTVGLANNLDTKVVQNDQDAYNFRTSGGSLEIGDTCKVKSIIGGSLGFNQLANNGNFASNSGWNGAKGSISISNNTLTYTATEIANNYYDNYAYQDVYSRLFSGHKYLAICYAKSSKAFPTRLYISNSSIIARNVVNLTSSYSMLYGFFQITSISYNRLEVAPDMSALGAVNDTIQAQNFVLFDLTAMFGSTIADYICSLEQATSGSGVAWFKRYFNKPYYPYTLIGAFTNVKTSGKKIVRFNQWDEQWEQGTLSGSTGLPLVDADRIRSKNFNKCLPNTSYSGAYPSGVILYILWYDANQNYISFDGLTSVTTTATSPENAYYFKISPSNTYGGTYNNDICVNFHYDGERDGEYEQYREEIYAMDDIGLIGIPKIDAQGNLYFDGDSYTPDGKVTRKYGIVDLGTLSWGAYTSDGGATTWRTTVPNSVNYQSDYWSVSLQPQFISTKYIRVAFGTVDNNNTSGSCAFWFDRFYVCDSSLDGKTAEQVKTAMSGVYLVYELNEPTEETTDTYQETQQVDNWGTEQYLPPLNDTRPCEVPVGHDTDYLTDLKSKLEILPNLPSTDGTYVCEVESGTGEYMPIGSWLSDNGWIKLTDITGYDATATQTLKNVNGTLTWVTEE